MGSEGGGLVVSLNDHALRHALDSRLFMGSPFWLKKEQDLIDVSSLMRSRDRGPFFSHRQLTKTVRGGLLTPISEEEVPSHPPVSL